MNEKLMQIPNWCLSLFGWFRGHNFVPVINKDNKDKHMDYYFCTRCANSVYINHTRERK